MAKSKNFELYVEQILGHFIGLGLVLGAILGPFAIIIYLVREFSKLRIGKWKIGQWPPGKPIKLFRYDEVWHDAQPWDDEGFTIHELTQLDRVADMRRDLIFTFAGYGIAQIAREIAIGWGIFG